MQTMFCFLNTNLLQISIFEPEKRCINLSLPFPEFKTFLSVFIFKLDVALLHWCSLLMPAYKCLVLIFQDVGMPVDAMVTVLNWVRCDSYTQELAGIANQDSCLWELVVHNLPNYHWILEFFHEDIAKSEYNNLWNKYVFWHIVNTQ